MEDSKEYILFFVVSDFCVCVCAFFYFILFYFLQKWKIPRTLG
jgi:hypothetical protein